MQAHVLSFSSIAIEGKESGKVHILITVEYLAEKEDELNAITNDINGLTSNDDQETLDQIYDNLVTTLRDAGVQEEHKEEEAEECHPWWNRELWKRKKDFRKAERLWLQCKDRKKRRAMREVYTLKRKEYSRAIKHVQEKRNFNEMRERGICKNNCSLTHRGCGRSLRK